MATVYGAHLSPEEREIEMIMLESDAEWTRIQAMEYILEASTTAAYLEAERNVLANSGTAEDLEQAYLMVEADNEGKGEGILARIGNWIVTQVSKFTEWLGKVFKPKLKESDTIRADADEVSWAQKMLSGWNSAKGFITGIVDKIISGVQDGSFKDEIIEKLRDILKIAGIGTGILAATGVVVKKTKGEQDFSADVIGNIQEGATTMLNELKEIGSKISDAYNANLAKQTGGAETHESVDDDIDGELFEEASNILKFKNLKGDAKGSSYDQFITKLNNANYDKTKIRPKTATFSGDGAVDLNALQKDLDSINNQFGSESTSGKFASARQAATNALNAVKTAANANDGNALDPATANSNAEANGENVKVATDDKYRSATGKSGNEGDTESSKKGNKIYEKNQKAEARANANAAPTADTYYAQISDLAKTILNDKEYTAEKENKYQEQFNTIAKNFGKETPIGELNKNHGSVTSFNQAMSSFKSKGSTSTANNSSTNTATNGNANGAENPPAEQAPAGKPKITDQGKAALETVAQGVRSLASWFIQFFASLVGHIGNGAQTAAAAANAAADSVKGVPAAQAQPVQDSTELSSIFGVSDDDLMDINESYNEDLESLDDLFAML